MELSKKIKLLREQKNMSVYKLAQVTDISTTYLHKLEAGKSHPTIDMLERIVKGLGYTLSDFFSEDVPEMTPNQRLLLEGYDSLREDQQKAIRDLIEVLKKQ